MNKTVTTIIVLIAIVFGYFIFRGFPEKTLPVATENNSTSTEEAVLPTDWKTYTDKENHLVFSYPDSLNTKYVQLVDWPPKIEVSTSTYSCLNAGKEIERAGETKEISVNGNIYCQTKVVEGAAGSIYTQFAYAAKVNNKVLYYTFTLREPQCVNYNEPERANCSIEEESFDINSIVDKVIQSTKFTN